ncbi:hypothetical protein BDQ12DRAFT_718143 [Crucibulum laeve]|uniref:Uncharacterized protein n=1 Tax=Crucibulum laeve TaxID=68775 RepID=A0A5C3ML32_9AGAR|nr:hypothetical protein BDQ12DRAFT_718143 [Crucibulum laeve]
MASTAIISSVKRTESSSLAAAIRNRAKVQFPESLSAHGTTDASFCSVDDDEHTLTGYGDISLSNADFVPSLPSDLSPIRRLIPRGQGGQRGRRSPAPLMPNVASFFEDGDVHLVPDLIRKILPPSPSKAKLTSDMDFGVFLDKERTIRAPRPLRAINFNTILYDTEKSDTENIHVDIDVEPMLRALDFEAFFKDLENREPRLDNAAVVSTERKKKPVNAAPVSIPQSKTNKSVPFRGGLKRLPTRPPLPRWDFKLLTSKPSTPIEERSSLFGIEAESLFGDDTGSSSGSVASHMHYI